MKKIKMSDFDRTILLAFIRQYVSHRLTESKDTNLIMAAEYDYIYSLMKFLNRNAWKSITIDDYRSDKYIYVKLMDEYTEDEYVKEMNSFMNDISNSNAEIL